MPPSNLSWLTTFALALTSVSAAVSPTGCVAFDSSWNLLAFGFNGKDYNAGAQDTWGSGTATDITKTGRPPFNAENTTCYLSQFNNAIYVLNADSADLSSVYVYDAAGGAWSTQKADKGQFDPSDFAAILDHDTNVFYAYSKGELFSLNMDNIKTASSSAIPWQDVQKPDLSVHTDNNAEQTPGAGTDGYKPVIALAQNHVHFLGVPSLQDGQAKIFVIHFSYMQPTPQSYGTPAFPNTHGKATSFFKPEGGGVQTEFAFIPDDGSATYVINVVSNSTKGLAGPPKVDALASYAASPKALVQLSSDGKVSYLAYDPDTTTSGGTWASVSKLPTAAFTTGTGNGTSTSNAPAGSQTLNSGSSSNGSSQSSAASGRVEASISIGMAVAGAMAFFASVF